MNYFECNPEEFGYYNKDKNVVLYTTFYIKEPSKETQTRETFTYDHGKLVFKDMEGATTDLFYDKNKIIRSEHVSLSHDKEVRDYFYDDEDRLIFISSDTNNWEIFYDNLGRCVRVVYRSRTSSNEIVTSYVYNNNRVARRNVTQYYGNCTEQYTLNLQYNKNGTLNKIYREDNLILGSITFSYEK